MGWVGLVWGSGLLPVRKTVAGDGGLVTGTRKKTDEGPAPVWEAGEAGEALLPVGDRNVPLEVGWSGVWEDGSRNARVKSPVALAA